MRAVPVAGNIGYGISSSITKKWSTLIVNHQRPIFESAILKVVRVTHSGLTYINNKIEKIYS